MKKPQVTLTGPFPLRIAVGKEHRAKLMAITKALGISDAWTNPTDQPEPGEEVEAFFKSEDEAMVALLQCTP